ncbi:hypothetical protein RRG08_020239 [Elysia crispata]|uniref:Uncharacterized protein n=1 Tax=Elysia crispata TaxID=231223 RepID=A0AAE1DR75_9GAST|nr:hypothetical protein RRG08_020239 [Elysia crispata]
MERCLCQRERQQNFITLETAVSREEASTVAKVLYKTIATNCLSEGLPQQ